jgi:hypothetical protein
MSALGQKQTLEHVRAMSALPPKADIDPQGRDVRFVPKADYSPLTVFRIALVIRQSITTSGAEYAATLW